VKVEGEGKSQKTLIVTAEPPFVVSLGEREESCIKGERGVGRKEERS